MGLMLSRMLGFVLGFATAPALIMTAFAGTGAIFLGMAALSTVIKRDLSTMGKFLFVGAIMVLVAGIANIFAAVERADDHAVGAGDRHLLGLHRLRPEAREDGLETNYITATLGVYLSIYNVFSALLSIFGLTSDRE